MKEKGQSIHEGGPVKLVYYESFRTKTEAMQAEYRFKQLSRKKEEMNEKERRR